MPDRRIVEVEWEDTCGSHSWQSLDEIPGPSLNISVGYVLEDDDKVLVLTESLDLSPTHPSRVRKEYGCTTTMPRSAVRKVTELSPQRPRRPRKRR